MCGGVSCWWPHHFANGVHMKRLATAVALTGVLCALAGCAESSAGEVAPPAAEPSTIPEPNFSGPYAAEFHQAFALAPDDEIRQMLVDETISDKDFQTVEQRYSTCLSSRGVTHGGFESDGSSSFTFESGMTSDEANAAADECSRSEGVDAVMWMYYTVRENPTNADTSQAMVACLIRAGVVPSTLTVEDLKAGKDLEQATVSRQEYFTAYNSCDADPEHAYAG